MLETCAHLPVHLVESQHYCTTASDFSDISIQNMRKHSEQVTADTICATLSYPCRPSFSTFPLLNLLSLILIQDLIHLPLTYYP